jgi:hypothetical protein
MGPYLVGRHPVPSTGDYFPGSNLSRLVPALSKIHPSAVSDANSFGN